MSRLAHQLPSLVLSLLPFVHYLPINHTTRCTQHSHRSALRGSFYSPDSAYVFILYICVCFIYIYSCRSSSFPIKTQLSQRCATNYSNSQATLLFFSATTSHSPLSVCLSTLLHPSYIILMPSLFKSKLRLCTLRIKLNFKWRLIFAIASWHVTTAEAKGHLSNAGHCCKGQWRHWKI